MLCQLFACMHEKDVTERDYGEPQKLAHLIFETIFAKKFEALFLVHLGVAGSLVYFPLHFLSVFPNAVLSETLKR